MISMALPSSFNVGIPKLHLAALRFLWVTRLNSWSLRHFPFLFAWFIYAGFFVDTDSNIDSLITHYTPTDTHGVLFVGSSFLFILADSSYIMDIPSPL